MFRNPYTDALLALLIVLLIFGPKRLPTLGRSLGQGLREFKDSITGHSGEDEEAQRPEITSTTTTPAPETAPEVTPKRESAEVGTSEPRS